jgi:drug/metabolite transporter (DMT)-like permease
MTFGYRFAEPSLLAPFDYTSMIWAVTFGLLIFGEIPALLVLVGAAIVTAAGAFIAFREHRIGRELASRVEAV